MMGPFLLLISVVVVVVLVGWRVGRIRGVVGLALITWAICGAAFRVDEVPVEIFLYLSMLTLGILNLVQGVRRRRTAAGDSATNAAASGAAGAVEGWPNQGEVDLNWPPRSEG